VSNSSSDAFKGVARRFWLAVREGGVPDPSLDEGLRVQAVYDAVQRANRERRWVEPEAVES
jgi:predicted dehydrogenase